MFIVDGGNLGLVRAQIMSQNVGRREYKVIQEVPPSKSFTVLLIQQNQHELATP